MQKANVKSIILSNILFQKSSFHSHSVGAVAAVVHRSRDGDDQRGNSVAHQVEVAPARVLALKHLHQHDVELHAFQEHPRERCQEEEVEQGGKDGAGNLGRVYGGRRKGKWGR